MNFDYPQAYEIAIGIVAVSFVLICSLIAVIFSVLRSDTSSVRDQVRELKIEFCKVKDRLPVTYMTNDAWREYLVLINKRDDDWREEVRGWRDEVRERLHAIQIIVDRRHGS